MDEHRRASPAATWCSTRSAATTSTSRSPCSLRAASPSAWWDLRFPRSPPRSASRCSMWFVSRAVRARAKKLGVQYSFLFMRASGAQLKELASLYDAGALRPTLDRTFPFEQTLDAMTLVESGRAKGKIVVVLP